MVRLILLFMGILLVSACAQIAQPTTTTPAPASSHGPLAQIDLETLVLQPGDLPPMDATPEKLPATPFPRPGIATSFASLFLLKQEYVYGSIYVDVYTDTLDAHKAYEADVALLQGHEQFGYQLITPAVGERAMLRYRAKDDGAEIVFQDCHARVSISFPPSKDERLVQDTILTYAQRLDGRLKPLVCS